MVSTRIQCPFDSIIYPIFLTVDTTGVHLEEYGDSVTGATSDFGCRNATIEPDRTVDRPAVTLAVLG
jgi:hypothetical protein